MSDNQKVKGASWLEPAYVPKSSSVNIILPFDYGLMSYDPSECTDKKLLERYSTQEIQAVLTNIQAIISEDVLTIRSDLRATFVLFIIWSILMISGAVTINMPYPLWYNYGIFALFCSLLTLPCWCIKMFHMEKVKKTLIIKLDQYLRRESQELRGKRIRWKRGGTDYYWLELWMDFKFDKFKKPEEIANQAANSQEEQAEDQNEQQIESGTQKKGYARFNDEEEA